MKNSPLLRCRFLLLWIILVLPAWPAAGQDASTQIKNEIERLQKSLQDLPRGNPNVAELKPMIEGSLKEAEEAVRVGHLYLSLQKLAVADDLLAGARLVMEKTDTVESGLPAFEAEWEKASKRLTAFDQQARQRNWKSAPAAVRALAEVAQGKSIPLLQGGRGFAVATKPGDGLFYIGQAEGNAEFAKFCASLNFAGIKAPYALRSLLPELQGLQEKTNLAYQPPQSVDLHPRFIQLNSTLKLAKELDATEFYAGALLEYLEAVRDYGMLSASPVEASKQATLKQGLAKERTKLSESPLDESIAQLFVERAESQIAHADGSAPSVDEWRSTSVILEQVLPAYHAAREPVAPLQRASGKTVNITLVRWPYT
jgi:hypothetical protein